MFILISSILLLTITSASKAAFTTSVGGTGGIVTKRGDCLVNAAMTGVRGLVSPGGSLFGISIRCTPIDSEGKWSGEHTFFPHIVATGNVVTTPPNVGATVEAVCPQDTWVYTVRGYLEPINLGDNTLRALAFRCMSATDNERRGGKLRGLAQTRIVFDNERHAYVDNFRKSNQWSPWAECPNYGIARGVSIKLGDVFDSLRLNCIEPSPKPNEPRLVWPTWNNDGTGNSNYRQSTPIPAFRLAPVSTANRYELVLQQAEGNHRPFFRRFYDSTEARNIGGTLEFPVDIPRNMKGKVVGWTARACRNNVCSKFTKPYERLIVLTSPPQLGTPRQTSPGVLFSWSKISSAKAGYDIEIHGDGEQRIDGTTNSATENSLRTNIYSGFGNPLRWRIRSCANYMDRGRVCGLWSRYKSWSR